MRQRLNIKQAGFKRDIRVFEIQEVILEYHVNICYAQCLHDDFLFRLLFKFYSIFLQFRC